MEPADSSVQSVTIEKAQPAYTHADHECVIVHELLEAHAPPHRSPVCSVSWCWQVSP